LIPGQRPRAYLELAIDDLHRIEKFIITGKFLLPAKINLLSVLDPPGKLFGCEMKVIAPHKAATLNNPQGKRSIGPNRPLSRKQHCINLSKLS